MNTQIIVTGVKGRMGNTVARMVREADDLELCAVLEREGNTVGLEEHMCRCGADPAGILPNFPKAVLVDFTAPEASLANARAAEKCGNAIVIGTTGFKPEQVCELEDMAKRVPIFWSPNMSVGVNALLRVLPELVRMLGEKYDLEMVELHHNRKKDAPSGTALKLAECLAEARNWNLKDVANYHREGIIGERPQKEIGVQTIRGGDVVGVHTVFFMGPGERIEVTHHAHSRETFAQGALRAARAMAGQQPGKIYSFDDLF